MSRWYHPCMRNGTSRAGGHARPVPRAYSVAPVPGPPPPAPPHSGPGSWMSVCYPPSDSKPATAKTGTVVAVGAENEYANVISQVGGKYVRVTAIESNPGTDPHAFEASASVSRVVGAAELVVQNGLGYDSFMNTIESGSPSDV